MTSPRPRRQCRMTVSPPRRHRGRSGSSGGVGGNREAVLDRDFRGSGWCHTAVMTHAQPPDPRVEKTWVNDAGELFVSDGTSWLPYEDLPDWPGADDPDSKA